MPVADEAATKLPVTGIMIENSPESRPQSGLKNAGVVYEAVAEGGITRFIALYQGAKPALIGPDTTKEDIAELLVGRYSKNARMRLNKADAAARSHQIGRAHV